MVRSVWKAGQKILYGNVLVEDILSDEHIDSSVSILKLKC